MLDEIQALVQFFFDAGVREAQNSPAVDREQILPLPVSLKVFEVLAMILKTVDFNSKALLNKGNVDPVFSTGNGPLKLGNRMRPSTCDGIEENLLRIARAGLRGRLALGLAGAVGRLGCGQWQRLALGKGFG